MQSLWRFLRRTFGITKRSPRRRSRPPAPALRILRLERRRVLSADFTLGASGLILEGFDTSGGETLSISQMDTEYRFTLNNGSWITPTGESPEGITLDGQTLAIKTALVDELVEGLTVVGDRSTPLHVSLGQADFSSLQGSLNFVGIRSMDQVEGTEVALGTSSSMLVMASQTGMSIGSLNVAGDVTILTFGAITDGDGTQINVTGDATFISRAFHPAADFDSSGEVTTDDYDIWAANFGLSVGATKAQGDANGDGAVDLADYSLWRDTLGQVYQPGGIFLADNLADQLTIGGNSTFEAQDGATRFDIQVGSMGTTHFGSLAAIGANVDVQEDSATVLMGGDAATFSLVSAGSITDADGTTIDITGLATFNAGANPITLGDHATDMTNFGQSHLTGGSISVMENSATELTGASAATLHLTSAGAITDSAGATIDVTGAATFHAGAAITLADNATDVLTVGGLATFRAGAMAPFFNITIDSAGAVNFGQLHLTGAVVTVQEDSATELMGVVATPSFDLESAGPITDSATAVIEVTGPASFTAEGKITLADAGPANSLIVHGLGSFVVTDGRDIDIGMVPATGLPALANAQLGSLQFTAIDGQVRVSLDGPIILSGSGSGGANEAGETELATTAGSGGNIALNDLATGMLRVSSDAAVVDAADSDVLVNGPAALTAKTFITLADEGSDNRFEVMQHASFTSTSGDVIDLGVVPTVDPSSSARGSATDAILKLGSFSFVSDQGNFTVNADNSVVLADRSLAGSAWISSAGAITDAFGADTTITRFAILKAADSSDIVLGDDSAPGDTRFRMDTPADPVAVFDASRFLAMKAENVSIQADSGFNLRTGPDDVVFPGTVFLAAAGNISQVGHEGGIEPLEANRIAMLSAAAVLFSQVRMNGQVTTDHSTAPNLAIRGGTPLPISVLPSGEFPVDLIPSSTITSFSPVGFNPDGTEQPRPDGSGLNDLAGARILEPSAIGDGYSIIMKVLGDAKVGIVPDATGVQTSLVGIAVDHATGNAFLKTEADDSGGESEAGNIVFTSMDATTSTIVRVREGVFTAIAAGELTIDTDQPGAADPGGLRTTWLTSDTGTVTSVEGYTTFDGGPPATSVTKVGPRMIVDAPHENQDAASTGLVFSPDFEQRITLVAGSRGENNLILEMEWADVQTPRDGGPPLGPSVQGTIPFPEVAYVPESVDSQAPQPFIQSSVPSLDFRAVTVRHNYAGEFIPDNPALPQLPTTIRLYNDPSINLYDQGGARNLNVADNFVSPRVISDVVAGYTEPSQPTPPTAFITVDRPVPTPVVTIPQSRVVVDEIRVSASSSAEVIRYGRVDENGEFINQPGEEWPVEWTGSRDGDFLNEIRDEVEYSSSPEGVYRIESKTPRAEQLLDEWVKGDAVEENEQEAGSGADASQGQDRPPLDEAAIELDEGAAAAPLEEQVGESVLVPTATAVDCRFGSTSNALLVGQLLVGAATWALGRSGSPPSAAAQAGPSDTRIDLSRAGRRRRAWSRLTRPLRSSKPRNEFASS